MWVLISSRLVDFSGHIEQENDRFFLILNGKRPIFNMASVSDRSVVFFKGYFDNFIFFVATVLLRVFRLNTPCSFSFLITVLRPAIMMCGTLIKRSTNIDYRWYQYTSLWNTIVYVNVIRTSFRTIAYFYAVIKQKNWQFLCTVPMVEREMATTIQQYMVDCLKWLSWDICTTTKLLKYNFILLIRQAVVYAFGIKYVFDVCSFSLKYYEIFNFSYLTFYLSSHHSYK